MTKQIDIKINRDPDFNPTIKTHERRIDSILELIINQNNHLFLLKHFLLNIFDQITNWKILREKSSHIFFIELRWMIFEFVIAEPLESRQLFHEIDDGRVIQRRHVESANADKRNRLHSGRQPRVLDSIGDCLPCL